MINMDDVKPKRRISIPIVVLSNVILVLLISNVLTFYFLIQVKEEAVQQLKEKDGSYSILATNFDLYKEHNESLIEEVNDLKNQIKTLKTKNGDNYPFITVGSTKEHVKFVMGEPDRIDSNIWWYGNLAWISFDNYGLVNKWYDGGNTLKVK